MINGYVIEYASDPIYANAERDRIDITVKFANIGEEIRYTCGMGDTETHSQELYSRAIEGEFGIVAEYEPPPLYIPPVVTAAQGGVALIRGGWMDQILTIVNDPAMPAEHKWAWDKAQTWHRDSPSLNYIATQAGMSQDDLDALFIAAEEIKV